MEKNNFLYFYLCYLIYEKIIKNYNKINNKIFQK